MLMMFLSVKKVYIGKHQLPNCSDHHNTLVQYIEFKLEYLVFSDKRRKI